MAQPSGSLNGGIIGASNKTSFGKGRITEKTSTGTNLGAKQTRAGGRKYASGYLDNLDGPALQDAVNHYLDSNNLKTTSSTDTTPVSNEEHERNINEDKHLIRYIEPQYAGRVVREFKKIVRE